MQKLTVMDVIVQPNKNVIEFLEKIILGGASTKKSCSAAQIQSETPVPYEDSLKRLVWLTMDIKNYMFV